MHILMVLPGMVVVMASLECTALEEQMGLGSCESHEPDTQSRAASLVLLQRSQVRAKHVDSLSTQSNVSSVHPYNHNSHWFDSHSTGGCTGRNELGRHKLTFAECQSKCLGNVQCVSFEFRKDCPNPGEKKCCQLSNSCAFRWTVKNSRDKFNYYEKKYPISYLKDCSGSSLKFGKNRGTGSKCVTLKNKGHYCGHGHHYEQTSRVGGSFTVFARSSTKLCIERTDTNAGWDKDIVLACKESQCFVEQGKYCGIQKLWFGPSETNEQCKPVTSPQVFCGDAKFTKLTHERSSDTFTISQKQSPQICVRRTDQTGGWALRGSMKCKKICED